MRVQVGKLKTHHLNPQILDSIIISTIHLAGWRGRLSLAVEACPRGGRGWSNSAQERLPRHWAGGERDISLDIKTSFLRLIKRFQYMAVVTSLDKKTKDDLKLNQVRLCITASSGNLSISGTTIGLVKLSTNNYLDLHSNQTWFLSHLVTWRCHDSKYEKCHVNCSKV